MTLNLKHELVLNKDTKEEIRIDADDDFLRKLSSENKLISVCGSEVIYQPSYYRKNNVKVRRHFKAKSEFIFVDGKKCFMGEPMTYEHRRCQNIILEHLKKLNVYTELEKPFPEISRIADIYFEYNNKKYVIEVQRSRYSQDKYLQRTKDYHSIGVNICWLCLPDDSNSFRKRGFENSYIANNNYLLILPIDNLNLNNIFKIRFDNTKSRFEYIQIEEDYDVDDFINFLFQENFGIKSIFNLKSDLETIKEKIIDYEYKLNDVKTELFNYRDQLTDTILDLNKFRQDVGQLKSEKFHLDSYVCEKKNILDKPLRKLKEIEMKLQQKNQESEKLFKTKCDRLEEINDLDLKIEQRKKLLSDIMDSNVIKLLKKEGYIWEPMIGDLRKLE